MTQGEIAELVRSRNAWQFIGTHAMILLAGSWLFFWVIQLLQAYVW